MEKNPLADENEFTDKEKPDGCGQTHVNGLDDGFFPTLQIRGLRHRNFQVINFRLFLRLET